MKYNELVQFADMLSQAKFGNSLPNNPCRFLVTVANDDIRHEHKKKVFAEDYFDHIKEKEGEKYFIWSITRMETEHSRFSTYMEYHFEIFTYDECFDINQEIKILMKRYIDYYNDI